MTFVFFSRADALEFCSWCFAETGALWRLFDATCPHCHRNILNLPKSDLRVTHVDRENGVITVDARWPQ